jgi:hypothetical protein
MFPELFFTLLIIFSLAGGVVTTVLLLWIFLRDLKDKKIW